MNKADRAGSAAGGTSRRRAWRVARAMAVAAALGGGALTGGALVEGEAALAGGFGLREQSARGLGLSFAGVAAGSGGLTSAYWNPAIITDYSGFTMSGAMTGVLPRGRITADAMTPTWRLGPGRDIGLNGLLAAGVVAWQLSDRLWLGLSTGAPYGLATKSPFNWSGQVYGRSSRVMGVAASPMLGVRINDWLALGAGVTGQFIDVRLTQAISVMPDAASGVLAAESWGLGYMLGATITPRPGAVIGVGFRSSIRHALSGEMSAPSPVAGILATLPATAPLNTPEVLSVGVRQRLNPQWTLSGGFEWSNWSRLGHIPVRVRGGVAHDLAFAWRDGYMVALGVEYAFSQALQLRGGLGYEWSPVGQRARDVRLPDANRVWLSLGLGWRINPALSLDLAYAHLLERNAPIHIIKGHPQYAGLPWSGGARASADIISLGLNYRFDAPDCPF